jgi:hypothetical protein
MSLNKAQRIVNQLYERYGIDMVAYQTDELSHLKEQLEEFLDLEVDTDELAAPEDAEVDLDELEASCED